MAQKKKPNNKSNSTKKDNTEELTELISSTINKSLGEKANRPSYFLTEDGPVNVTDWVPSGSVLLDIIMSNIKGGGYPVGRMIELTGLEASGKSLLAAHSLANTQKKGGIGVYIDVEQSVSKDFLRAIGVDVEKLVYANIEPIEDIFQVIEEIIEKYKSNTNKLMTIVVDSIAATTTYAELNSDFKKDGYATDKAIIISKALRKITNLIAKEKICMIFTNQLREKMTTFGDPFTTSGGKAPAFHSSVRLRLKVIGKINGKVNGVDQVIGVQSRVETIKNRIAPPHQKVTLNIYFDRGIDDYESWLSVLNEMDIIKQSGAWYTYVNEDTGEEIKFQRKDFYDKVLANSDHYEYLYNKLVDNMVRHYKIDSYEASNTKVVKEEENNEK